MPFSLGKLAPPDRLLLGAGPSPVPPEVLAAMSRPILGHLDPAFIALMDETMEALRQAFRTRNRLTLPISGTGSAGMEAAVANLVEPGDRVVVGVCGYFGGRIAEMARRQGAEVVKVEAPWGEAIDPARIEAALAERPAKAVAVVHAETSTGVLQALEPIAAAARRHGALLIADVVTSLGGLPLDVDALGIDAAFSGSQKCLGAPPGLAPLTVSERALAAMRARKTPLPSWYLDLSLLDGYWSGGTRVYHHTAPISMVFALREALRLVFEEGLEARWRRHQEAHAALVEGLSRLGLDLMVRPEHRLPVLNAVHVPEGVDEKAARRRLLEDEGIEVGAGLGPLAGKVFRIGLMGHGARLENVERVLAAIGRVLGR
jgi:alanine-glyoxylate transaminase/serine-glyoxylate transaminase/serine-pyruvate transaminase